MISKDEMVTIFKSISGATFVGINYIAPVDMKKTGNPYVGKEVLKTTQQSGQFGFDYEAGMNRTLAKEGIVPDFVAGPRTWGVNEGKGIIINPKTGDISIQLRVEAKPSSVTYTIDGVVVDKVVLEPFLPVHKPSTYEGVDKPTVRTYRADRIKSLRINGEEYLVS